MQFKLFIALVLCCAVGQGFTAPTKDVFRSKIGLFRGGSTNPLTIVGGSTDLAATPPPPELKPSPALFQNAVTLGTAKGNSSIFKIFVLGILSGAQIGFGILLASMVGGDCGGLAAAGNNGLKRILTGAFGLPFGLYMVLVGGGELYTGNTALVTAAYLEKKVTLKQLAKSWITSYLGNFVGALAMVSAVASANIISNPAAVVGMASAKVAAPFMTAFWRGVLCNYLVCMAVWMATGASSAIGKAISIFFPISAFVALGTDHSVANMMLIPLGMKLGGEISVSDFLMKNLLPVTLGNTFAGAVLVATMFYFAYGSFESKKK